MAVTQDQDVRQAEEKVELSPSQALWLRMKNHRGLVTGFFIIVTLILLAILAPVLAPLSDQRGEGLTERRRIRRRPQPAQAQPR